MSLNEPLMPMVPTGSPSFRPLRGLGIAAVVMVVISCVVGAVDTAAGWYAYDVLDDYLNGGGATDADLVSVEELVDDLTPWLLLFPLATPVVFVVWLWRARKNGEAINPTAHRLSRGWTIGGWICPGVNFWFPFRIVHDIWQVSRPAGVSADKRVLHLWWTAWVLFLIARIWLRIETRKDIAGLETPQEILDRAWNIAVAGTVTTVFECLAGVFVIVVVRQITRWQSAPRPM